MPAVKIQTSCERRLIEVRPRRRSIYAIRHTFAKCTLESQTQSANAVDYAKFLAAHMTRIRFSDQAGHVIETREQTVHFSIAHGLFCDNIAA